jgi:hypothetical protein
MNLYGFAGGDPVNFSDPFGLCKDANGNPRPADFCPESQGLKDVSAETFGVVAGVVGLARGLIAAGLDALTTASASGTSGEAGSVATAELRATHSVSQKAVKRLAKDIDEKGIQEPLKYVEHQGEKYVVDGNHRLRAAINLGLEKVPAQQVTLPFRQYLTPADLTYVRIP